ncbi:ABC transporter substrate-binding protein [Saliphagus sp. GCM10025334]
MSTYLTYRGQGIDDFVAIPVFPSRYFRHSCLFVNADAGIEQPEDLAGRTVGIPEYQMTAALWIRGMLQHDYGVHASDMHWFQGGLEEGGREQMADLDLPEDIQFDTIPEDETLSDLLGTGELDALVTARSPSSFETDSVERLFPNFKEVEMDYYERTELFPIMHVIVIRKEVYDEVPWVAQELLEAFTESKNICLKQIGDTGVLKTALPWVHSELHQTRELMGWDYWQFGVENNRNELEAMTQYAVEQGLMEEKLDVEELFAPNTYHGSHKV